MKNRILKKLIVVTLTYFDALIPNLWFLAQSDVGFSFYKPFEIFSIFESP